MIKQMKNRLLFLQNFSMFKDRNHNLQRGFEEFSDTDNR